MEETEETMSGAEGPGDGLRRLDAAAVNREASRLDGMPVEENPTDQTRQEAGNSANVPTPVQATAGEKPLEAELEEEQAGLFPPDVEPSIEVGGSPEDQQMLREEFTQQ